MIEEESAERLIDQAMANPIKNVFKIGWEAVIINKTTMIGAISILILLGLVGLVPQVGIPIAVISATLMVSAQIYIARVFENADDMHSFASDIEQITLNGLLRTHFMTALGSYFAWVVLFLVPLVLTLLTMPQDIGTLNPESIMHLAKNFIPFLIFILVILYVQPLVQYNIIKAEGFSSGFKAVFTLFSSALWSRAMSASYFSYIAKFGLVIFFLMFLFGMVLGLLASIFGFPMEEMAKDMSPIFQMIIGSINTLFTFLFMIIMSIFIMLAYKISQSNEVN